MNSQCTTSGKITVLIFAILCVLVGFGWPSLLLVSKPAGSQELYAAGWQSGCQTGVAANAPLRSLIGSTPFVKNGEPAKDGKAGELYKSGWNEGFTVCRFNQGAWYELLGVLLIVLVLGCTRCRCGRNA